MAIGKLSLRKIKTTDEKYFAVWWRDEALLELTSGVSQPISDEEVKKYFSTILQSADDYHFMVALGRKAIGHISLAKRKDDWYETQIIIGEKGYWGKGYGTQAIQMLIKKLGRFSIKKVFLEVRPTNLRAISAYRKCGFTEAGVKMYPQNKNLPEVLRMELKKLTVL